MTVDAVGTSTLRARHVVPLAGPPIENGWLRIECGRIVAVGGGTAPGPAFDLGDVIVLPGLVNAHTHLEFSSLDVPLPGEGGLPGWIRRVVAMRRARIAADPVPAAIHAGLEESARAGVTTIGEIATACPPAGPARPGPRLRVFLEALGLSAGAGAAACATVPRDLAIIAGRGAAAGVSPHAPYSVASPLGRRVLEIARRRRLPAAMHLGESAAEAEFVATARGPFRELLESLGAWPAIPPRLLTAADWISLLAKGPRGVVVHGTFLDDDALVRLGRHRGRLAVVVCPRTARLLAGTLPPLARLRSAGVRVAIGTDSRASTPDLSVLAECRALCDGGLTSPAEALRMATVHGAWALAMERQAGVIAPGRPADLVVLQPSRPTRDPHEAALDPTTRVAATLRAGTAIHGGLAGQRLSACSAARGGSSRSRSL